MAVSMTGFASQTGSFDGYDWNWDIRSVNAKGLDIRTRLPDWANAVDVKLRAITKASVTRGNVSIALRIQKDETAQMPEIDVENVTRLLANVKMIEDLAQQNDIALAPTTAADILNNTGAISLAIEDEIPTELLNALVSDFETLLQSFLTMRQSEGQEVSAMVSSQIDQIAVLVGQAQSQLPTREEGIKAQLNDAIARITKSGEGVDPGRVAQEMALLLVKADVTEEIDRLKAHITAARDMMGADAPIGRKMDFLCQEFNREANTLCSKSNSKELTAIGLDLKVVIDQMREQIQNLE